MKNSRRTFIKGSAFGILGLTVPGSLYASKSIITLSQGENLYDRYPAISNEEVKSIVSASHSRFDDVKELVTKRPELANAVWDWGFGDFETALGAASHMARVDIADFLMKSGARPDIFTFAMLGNYEVVKGIIESLPGIQRIPGPHGITLLQHAKNRLRRETTTSEKNRSEKLISYLERLGDADLKPESLETSEEEKQMLMGDYRFGAKDNEVFIVDMNMRKMLQIKKKGESGRPLFKSGALEFTPSGSTSVKIKFDVKENRSNSLTIITHTGEVVAKRI